VKYIRRRKFFHFKHDLLGSKKFDKELLLTYGALGSVQNDYNANLSVNENNEFWEYRALELETRDLRIPFGMSGEEVKSIYPFVKKICLEKEVIWEPNFDKDKI
ncbi:MAG: hypothetical protein LBM13_01475, partial [Candidatus Ancillula sp.]|nr:hypothetical protein [Candidatus Ancillula sp.]